MLAVWGKGQRTYGATVAGVYRFFGAGVHIPDADAAFQIAGSHFLAIGRDRHAAERPRDCLTPEHAACGGFTTDDAGFSDLVPDAVLAHGQRDSSALRAERNPG